MVLEMQNFTFQGKKWSYNSCAAFNLLLIKVYKMINVSVNHFV